MQKHITDNIMNEYRFHLQKYKPGSKTVTMDVEAVKEKYGVTPRQLIDVRERFLSRDTWVNATTSTVVAITIPRKNTSGTIRQQGKHRLAIK